MAVSEDDVRNIALLARLGIDDARIPKMVDELNGILAHMDVLQGVPLGDAALDEAPVHGMALRPDENTPVTLARARADFAPAARDGFFLVPRLATHGDGVATSDSGEDDE